jgi:hypothetical protein
MKIACLVSSLSRNAGGVHDSVRRLCQTLHAHASTEVHVFGTSDEHTHLDLPSWSPVRTHAFSVLGPRQFGFAPGNGTAFYHASARHAGTVGDPAASSEKEVHEFPQ